MKSISYKYACLALISTLLVIYMSSIMAKQGQIPGELKRLGVRRMYPKAIADEEAIKLHIADDPVPTPGASEIARNLITLPTHMGITETLAREIANKVAAMC